MRLTYDALEWEQFKHSKLKAVRWGTLLQLIAIRFNSLWEV
jgi:hypothetical protein